MSDPRRKIPAIRGGANSRAVLDEGTVIAAWDLHLRTGFGATRIAREIGMEGRRTGKLINHVLRGSAWNHVTGLPDPKDVGRPPTVLRGEEKGNAVLDDATVREIWRLRCERGYTAPQIVAYLGSNDPSARDRINHVIKGRSWNHVTGLPRKPSSRAKDEETTR